LIKLRIHHKTSYRYGRPVSFGPHRMMLRPRESLDIRLTSCELKVTPIPSISWTEDVFGNAIATATFEAMDDSLVIENIAKLELHAMTWPVFDIADYAVSYPFLYSNDDRTDLGAMTVQQYPDPTGQLQTWAQGFVHANPTDSLALLKDISLGVCEWITYEARDDEGTQTPIETLNRRRGSCRDLAVLFIEATRSLGFGARIVSGYLYHPDAVNDEGGDPGSTHAWAECYLPGAGWITFDPTNRIVGGANLIPVAVARDIHQVGPVAGSFVGMTDAFQGMSVEVRVTQVPD